MSGRGTRGVYDAYHPVLAILLAVSTVPPRTTSFAPSTTELPATPPTRGATRDLRASMRKEEVLVEATEEGGAVAI